MEEVLNFINQGLVQKLGLIMTRNRRFQVTVVNREKIKCAGMCQRLTMNIQRCVIITDYYVFPVAACPFVLEVQWLAILGPIETDYSKLMMQFQNEGNYQIFQGI